jgi:hypothetical protein
MSAPYVVWERDGDNPYRSLYVGGWLAVHLWDGGGVHVSLGRSYWRLRP